MVQQLEAPFEAPTPAHHQPPPPQAIVQQSDAALDHLLNIPVKIRAVLGTTTMALRAISELKVGTLIPLRRADGENIDLYVNGENLASAEVLVRGEQLSVRIAEFHAKP